MKIFENKSVFKKLIIVLLTVLILSFVMPNIVRAGDDDGVGGKLLDPLMSLFVGIGDGAISLLQKIVFDIDTTIIEVNTSISGLQKFLAIAVGIAVIVGGVIAIVSSVVTGGMSLAVIGAVVKVVEAGLIAGFVTYAASGYIANAALPEDFVLPEISISPYEIFSDKIALLDVDFFNPRGENEEIQKEVTEKTVLGVFSSIDHLNVGLRSRGLEKRAENADFEPATSYNSRPINEVTFTENNIKYQIKKTAETTVGSNYAGASTTYKYTLYKYETVTETKTVYSSSAYNLRPVISKWYTILRNISLVALLSVLVYTGIRIVISSTASDKSKYKQMLMDWIIAICLLFLMHYIMSFSNMLVKKVTEIVDSTKVVTEQNKPEDIKNDDFKDEAVGREGVYLFKIDDTAKVNKAYDVLVKSEASEKNIAESETQFYSMFTYEEGKKVLNWPADNFTEQARMMLQFVDEEEGVNNYAYESIGWKLIYCVLVIYTFVFLLTYLKRVMYMTFLTLMAPLVALTYPIDKMNDGKAQAFDRWLKEYIFNLLIQPLHLLLYMTLIGSAMKFAQQNIIYVIVALGFMTQGEKLLRSFFGFEKAHTPGILGGPAGAAIMMGGISKLLGGAGKRDGKGGKGGNGSDGSSGEDKGRNFRENLNTSELYAASDDNRPEENTDNERTTDHAGIDSNNNESQYDDESWDYYTGMANNNESQYDDESWDHYMSMADDNENSYDDGSWDNYIGMEDNNNDTIENQNVEDLDNDSVNLEDDIEEPVEDYSNNAGKWESFKANLKDKKDRSIRGFANIGDRLILKAENEQPLRKLARVGTGALAAAAIIPAAGMAAIVDGEGLGKSSQIIGGAALAGYKAGAGIPSDVMEQKAEAEANMEAFKEGYYGQEEYRKQKIKENVEKMQKDIKLRQELVRRLESEEAADKAINEIAPACVEVGLGKANEIATVSKLMESGQSMDRALMLTKTVKKYGQDTTSLGNEASEDLDKTIMKQVRRNSASNVSEEQIRKHTADLRKDYDTASKIFYQKL